MRRLTWFLWVTLGGCQAFLDGVDKGKDDTAADTDPAAVSHALAFVDVSEAAGITGHGSTFGMGWGDVNGDGRPDMWSGNHAAEPSLYLNEGDGTFEEVSHAWLPSDRTHDAHGISWVDLDNDGVQEMLVSAGSLSGTGGGSNRVYEQRGGLLTDVAVDHGLAYTGNSGRCPVAYDWNQDGLLDVLWVNQPRPDGQEPTALFTQGSDGRFTLEAEVPEASEQPTALCGMLADLDGDHVLDLVRFGRPNGLSAHDARSAALRDVTAELALPPTNRPFDVVAADFDNDLRNDLYITRWEEASEAVVDDDGKGVRLAMRLFGAAEGVRFRTSGDLTVQLDPPWFWRANEIRVGGGCVRATSLTRVITNDAAEAEGLCPFTPGVDRGLFVGRVDGDWTVQLATDSYDRGNLTLRSTEPLEALQVDVTPLTEDEVVSYNRDRLWMNTAGGWKDEGWKRGIQAPTTCTSVAAGDFDNDADLDLFLVCATPVENLPDRLLVNDGQGRFTEAVDFGASGSLAGRGDSVALADYDADGFLDLFVTNGYAAPPFNDGPHQLFRNVGNSNHWIELDLVGTTSNKEAIGSSALVTAGGLTQLREAGGGTHYMAQNFRRLHFGLGAASTVDRVEVIWPDGQHQILDDVPVDQVLTVVQAAP